MEKQIRSIVLGGGCFWCTEAIFQRIPGVIKVTPGYAGGTSKNPSYDSVSEGLSGHAEVIEVQYDEKKVGLPYLLEVFFAAHDPTTLNKQGNDVGTQYRSTILYADDSQKKIAENAIKKAQANFKEKIVTEISRLEKFHPAENYHKNYFESNPSQPYCKFVILPKIQKVEKKFGLNQRG
ncbi:peptide-methionine (S)-S-oxide reductase MsrA [Candidatus Micrarchaeota archaeon]|nr:peptide-methionine (S)-S-oxide reductase MsrA [Candidatus Micrarchaeota archaeon]